MKSEQNFVDWEDRFSVGVPVIDNQHKRLITMTNELHNACQHSDDYANEQFVKTVREAVAYVKYHFSTEEQVMEQIGYPGLLDHRRIHTGFAQEVLKNALYYKEGKKFVPNLFVRFLRDWILSHVAFIDSDMGEYIVELQNTGNFYIFTLDIKNWCNELEFHS